MKTPLSCKLLGHIFTKPFYSFFTLSASYVETDYCQRKNCTAENPDTVRHLAIDWDGIMKRADEIFAKREGTARMSPETGLEMGTHERREIERLEMRYPNTLTRTELSL